MKKLILILSIAFIGCGPRITIEDKSTSTVVDSLRYVVDDVMAKSRKNDSMTTESLKKAYLVGWGNGMTAERKNSSKVVEQFKHDSARFCSMVDIVFKQK